MCLVQTSLRGVFSLELVVKLTNRAIRNVTNGGLRIGEK